MYPRQSCLAIFGPTHVLMVLICRSVGSLPLHPLLSRRIVFAYGLLIYQLFGPGAEVSFVRSWGLGLAADNVAQLRSIVEDALKALMVVAFLDLVIVGVRSCASAGLIRPLCYDLCTCWRYSVHPFVKAPFFLCIISFAFQIKHR